MKMIKNKFHKLQKQSLIEDQGLTLWNINAH